MCAFQCPVVSRIGRDNQGIIIFGKSTSNHIDRCVLTGAALISSVQIVELVAQLWDSTTPSCYAFEIDLCGAYSLPSAKTTRCFDCLYAQVSFLCYDQVSDGPVRER